MTDLHFITHTHWDREWYLPFQVFRMKLVELVDKLLDILNTNDKYQHFMLDGQTIVLEDYLEIRPQNQPLLEKYIREGKIQIGPWYILPDEFLVSGEAIIRNLLVGKRICEEYGKRMMIGYIPDPFGHIGQMPQILKGFGIEYASFRRGLADEQVELWWQSPDGSKVLMSYLRDGYDNAVHLPLDNEENFISEVNRLASSLKPFVHTENLLLMNGSDHIEPDTRTSKFIECFNRSEQPDSLIQSTLERYFAAVDDKINQQKLELPVIQGEQRECKKHELLPGVLSSRIWIKQRNHDCEKLLEKWVEPFSVFALAANGFDMRDAQQQNQLIDYAWKSLLKCQPHDSICGCSIDQVHKEMAPRFDEIEQVGERIVTKNLEVLAGHINTNNQHSDCISAVVVFNAAQNSQSGIVHAKVPLPAASKHLEVVDEKGKVILSTSVSTPCQSLADLTFDREGMQSAIFMLSEGKISGMSVLDIGMKRKEGTIQIELVLEPDSPTNYSALKAGKQKIQEYLANEAIKEYSINARTPIVFDISWLAENVPGFGYRTYWFRAVDEVSHQSQELRGNQIENGILALSYDEKDGQLHLLDKRTGYAVSGFNQFEDNGDAGDEYNYNPPDINQTLYSNITNTRTLNSGDVQTLIVSSEIVIPETMTEDRKSRSEVKKRIEIISEFSLVKGIPRLDVKTKLNNTAKDHRLRVLFPTGIQSDHYVTDNQFIHSERKIEKIEFQDDFVEQPRPEVPQKLFTLANDDGKGLLIANQGLPEVEVFKNQVDEDVIALTLLRCTGWLSRDDLKLRPHTAGPVLPTPGAQEIGEHKFSYSIIPFGNDPSAAIQHARQFDLPMRSIATGLHSGSMSSESTFISVSPNSFEITACKISEDGKGWILRGVNQAEEAAQVGIGTQLSIQKASFCRLDEKPAERLNLSRGKLEFQAEKHQIVSILNER